MRRVICTLLLRCRLIQLAQLCAHFLFSPIESVWRLDALPSPLDFRTRLPNTTACCCCCCCCYDTMRWMLYRLTLIRSRGIRSFCSGAVMSSARLSPPASCWNTWPTRSFIFCQRYQQSVRPFSPLAQRRDSSRAEMCLLFLKCRCRYRSECDGTISRSLLALE